MGELVGSSKSVEQKKSCGFYNYLPYFCSDFLGFYGYEGAGIKA